MAPGDGVGLDATATLDALATEVAQAQAPAPGEGDEPVPPVAPPSASPTATLTPTVTATATPSVPMVEVSVNTNCRLGPGKIYDYLGALLVGETTEIIARSSEGEYWVVKNPDRPGETCWLWGQYAAISGDTSALPVRTPPPTPTPTPIPLDFSLALDTAGSCMTWGIFLRIQNTGPMAFESFTASVEDFDLGETHTNTLNMFPDIKACIMPPPPVTLDPGASAYPAVFGFSANPTGHNVRVWMKVCTANGLGGECVEKVLEGVVP